MTTNNILYFLHAPQSAIHPWPIEVHGILAHNLIKFTQEGFNRFYKYTKGIPMYINSFYNVLSSHETYDEVITYWAGIKLMLRLATPVASVVL